MSQKYRSCFIFLLLIGLHLSVSSQVVHGEDKGRISGKVRDSVLNFFMQAATVAIYKVGDSTLISYTLTNNLGSYHFQKLPIGKQLKLVVSYVGYATGQKVFTLSDQKDSVDLGEMNLLRNEAKYEDSIVVMAPPVRMNGDTLEFSAAAFKMDQNAVAEDLLRKLPGVIVWGDGTITVNGKQINQLLVDGKQFFGGDVKVATQNIPKTAISKVQIYQEQINPNNPFDSITTVNLKLKKDSHQGAFGSVRVGAGTQNKHEGEISQNFFSTKNQFAIAAQGNNINRISHDFNTLLVNNVFKGIGARVEYQPDFSLPGENKTFQGGFLVSHDFLDGPDKYKMNKIEANSFIEKINNYTLKDVSTLTAVGNGNYITQDSRTSSNGDGTSLNLQTTYGKRNDFSSFQMTGAVDLRKNLNQMIRENATYDPLHQKISSDFENDSTEDHINSLTITSNYFHHGFENTSTHRLSTWNIAYVGKVESQSRKRLLTESLIADPQTGQRIDYNRNYLNDGTHFYQNLLTELGDFSSWLFYKNPFFSSFRVSLRNNLNIDMEKADNEVKDLDSLQKLYVPNAYLSENRHLITVKETPSLVLSRSFENVLANRFQKTWNVNAEASYCFYSQTSTSTATLRNFTRAAQNFLPSASISYSNFQFSEYLDRFELGYAASASYPSLDQLYSLVDSANIYYLRIGNAKLTPSIKHQVLLAFKHDSYRTKNTFNYGVTLTAGLIDKYFADSVIVDKLGRYNYYNVNLSNSKYAQAALFLNKAFILKHHQLQLRVRATGTLTKTPSYLTYARDSSFGLNISENYLTGDTVSVYYNFNETISAELSEGGAFYHSSQKGFSNTTFYNTQIFTRLGIGVNLTKKLFLNNTVALYRNVSTGLSSRHYTIWNASIAYRLLTDNSLELKLSGLDLLNQNTGVVNYGSSYTLTHGSINMLRQYFMMTLTYFPRKFSKGRHQK